MEEKKEPVDECDDDSCCCISTRPSLDSLTIFSTHCTVCVSSVRYDCSRCSCSAADRKVGCAGGLRVPCEWWWWEEGDEGTVLLSPPPPLHRPPPPPYDRSPLDPLSLYSVAAKRSSPPLGGTVIDCARNMRAEEEREERVEGGEEEGGGMRWMRSNSCRLMRWSMSSNTRRRSLRRGGEEGEEGEVEEEGVEEGEEEGGVGEGRVRRVGWKEGRVRGAGAGEEVLEGRVEGDAVTCSCHQRWV